MVVNCLFLKRVIGSTLFGNNLRVFYTMLFTPFRCAKVVDKLVIQKFIPNLLTIIPTNTMQSSMTLEELKLLFGRLQDAKTQADALKTDLKKIRKDLAQAESLTIFQHFKASTSKSATSRSRSELTDNSEDSDDEAPKSKRFKSHLFIEDQNGYVIVYTDGACENNGHTNAKAGIGVWFDDNHPLNVSRPVIGRATNNTAEIQACIAAVEIARKNGIDKLRIITDSQFTINSMTKWIQNWKNKGWKKADGAEVKNKTDFQKLDQLCKGISIQWEHVAGHAGVLGNEKADMLARDGAKLYKM